MRQSACKRQPTCRRPSANKNLKTNNQTTQDNDEDNGYYLSPELVKDVLISKKEIEAGLGTAYEFG